MRWDDVRTPPSLKPELMLGGGGKNNGFFVASSITHHHVCCAVCCLLSATHSSAPVNGVLAAAVSLGYQAGVSPERRKVTPAGRGPKRKSHVKAGTVAT